MKQKNGEMEKHKTQASMKTTWYHGWIAHEPQQTPKTANLSIAINVVYQGSAALKPFVVG